MPSSQPSRVKSFFTKAGKVLAGIAGAGAFGLVCYGIGALIGLAGVAAFAGGLGIIVGSVVVINCAGYGIYKLVEHYREKRSRRRSRQIARDYNNGQLHRRFGVASTRRLMVTLRKEQRALNPQSEQAASLLNHAEPVSAPRRSPVRSTNRVAKFLGWLFGKNKQHNAVTQQDDLIELSTLKR